MKARRPAGGCGWAALWVLAAFVLATGCVLHGTGRVTESWHRCLTQDHEPDPRTAAATRSVRAVVFVVLLLLGAVLSPLPRSRWYLPPVLAGTFLGLRAWDLTGHGHHADFHGPQYRTRTR
ncbi:hypothetical protein [Kitasatospora sp. NPDC093679]|uniref:hypothetical protein n=1 Tax=Kitasatospora sp. NPDC093679 TaxID=3154983 RepID=UPI00341709BB